MPKLTLSEVRSEDDSNMILDENTGEFVNANIKNVTNDFGSKCMLDSDGSKSIGFRLWKKTAIHVQSSRHRRK